MACKCGFIFWGYSPLWPSIKFIVSPVGVLFSPGGSNYFIVIQVGDTLFFFLRPFFSNFSTWFFFISKFRCCLLKWRKKDIKTKKNTQTTLKLLGFQILFFQPDAKGLQNQPFFLIILFDDKCIQISPHFSCHHHFDPENGRQETNNISIFLQMSMKFSMEKNGKMICSRRPKIINT